MLCLNKLVHRDISQLSLCTMDAWLWPSGGIPSRIFFIGWSCYTMDDHDLCEHHAHRMATTWALIAVVFTTMTSMLLTKPRSHMYAGAEVRDRYRPTADNTAFPLRRVQCLLILSIPSSQHSATNLITGQLSTASFFILCPERSFPYSDLVLRKPVDIEVGPMATSKQLKQEFIRVKKGHEFFKTAMLANLLTKYYKKGVIVFCAFRSEAHRLHVVFNALGFQCAELHGKMGQVRLG